MRIAIEGCSHGCLDQIYASILAIDEQEGKQTDLLILCGDVQTLRNHADLHCLAVPEKYKMLGDFHQYYKGEKVAPIVTILIGGNHEASNYLWELYYGGWVAPNMYFMGMAGCIEIGGLMIAGISGIFKSHDFPLGRFETMPYNAGTVRSVYHTRCFDTFRLHFLSRINNQAQPDIVLSHDWPNTVEQYGDVKWLIQKKPFFRNEIQSKSLGSPPLMDLLYDLKPKFWFSAHLHVRFAALVKHGQQGLDGIKDSNHQSNEQPKLEMNDDEIDIDIDDLEPSPEPQKVSNEIPSNEKPKETRFLALSKCLEGQDFLQMLEVPAPYDQDPLNQFSSVIENKKQPSIRFSASWLAILRATHPLLSLERRHIPLPSLNDEILVNQIQQEFDWIQETILSNKSEGHPLDIIKTQKFTQTAPPSSDTGLRNIPPPPWYTNPQTVELCKFIQIPNKINAPPPMPPNQLASFPGSIPMELQPPQVQNHSINSSAEEEEVRKIEEAAKEAMQKRLDSEQQYESEEIVVTLSDDEEDEQNARWKEGTG